MCLVRVTKRCRVLWAVNILGWLVASVAAVAVAYPPYVNPWWFEVLRGPIMAGLMASMSVALVSWHLVAALPRMFDSGVSHGMRLCERNHRDAHVVPIQGRRSRAELS